MVVGVTEPKKKKTKNLIDFRLSASMVTVVKHATTSNTYTHAKRNFFYVNRTKTATVRSIKDRND